MTNFNEWLRYDPMTGHLTWLKGRRAGHIAGSFNKTLGYLQVRVEGRLFYAHRIIMEMTGCPIPAGYVVDHINGNRLDNSRSNLRVVTLHGNAQNQKPKAARKLPRGVFYEQDRQRYRADVRHRGRSLYIGRFETAEQAAAAAAQKRAELRFLDGSA